MSFGWREQFFKAIMENRVELHEVFPTDGDPVKIVKLVVRPEAPPEPKATYAIPENDISNSSGRAFCIHCDEVIRRDPMTKMHWVHKDTGTRACHAPKPQDKPGRITWPRT